MNLKEAIAELRARNVKVPRPPRLPTPGRRLMPQNIVSASRFRWSIDRRDARQKHNGDTDASPRLKTCRQNPVRGKTWTGPQCLRRSYDHVTMLPMLFFATPGSGIRPMDQPVFNSLAGVIGLFVGVPASVAGMFLGRGRQRWLGVLGVMLNWSLFFHRRVGYGTGGVGNGPNLGVVMIAPPPPR